MSMWLGCPGDGLPSRDLHVEVFRTVLMDEANILASIL
jgi:hypothetical protein